MNYKKCGKEIFCGASFCAFCGTMIDTNNATRKIIYDGEIHKCPSCGEVLNSFVANCPTCRYELRGATLSNSVTELAQKLDQTTSIKKKTI